jgi:hypothetical protein
MADFRVSEPRLEPLAEELVGLASRGDGVSEDYLAHLRDELKNSSDDQPFFKLVNDLIAAILAMGQKGVDDGLTEPVLGLLEQAVAKRTMNANGVIVRVEEDRRSAERYDAFVAKKRDLQAPKVNDEKPVGVISPADLGPRRA